MKLLLALLACALSAAAVDMDGHWNAEIVRGKNAAGQATSGFSLDIKTEGGTVSGIVAIAGKKKPQFQKMENARLAGGHLTFTTAAKGKKSSAFSWDVALQGDQLVGSRTRDGGKRSQSFTAKRN